MFENVLGCTELQRALKIGFISFSWRFERFRRVLVKNHARMGWDNKYRGTKGEGDVETSRRWLVEKWRPLTGQA